MHHYFKSRAFLALLGVLCIAAILRFWNCPSWEFRFCDEGYMLLPSVQLHLLERAEPVYYYYFGLMRWISLGCKLFGFTQPGALAWAAVNGMLAVVAAYAFASMFLRQRAALLFTFAFATCKYLLFYHRSNLCAGYAILFLLVCMAASALTFNLYGLLPCLRLEISERIKRFRLLVAILSGILWGVLFTVRMDSFVILAGVCGALFLALLIKRRELGLFSKDYLRFAGLGFLQLSSGVFFYCLFVLSIWKCIKWPPAIAFYKEHFLMPSSGWSEGQWHPFLFEHLHHFCGIPLLLLSVIGLASVIAGVKRIDLFRLWMLLCLGGLAAAAMLSPIPYPRAHIYFVIFLLFFWVWGVESVVDWLAERGKLKPVLTILLLGGLTFFQEFKLALPLLNGQSGYRKAIAFMAGRGPSLNTFHTHSWPVIRCSFPYQGVFFISDVARDSKTYGDFCWNLREGVNKHATRYLISDHNLTYLCKNSSIVQQFILSNAPSFIAYNDFGEDMQTCLDAFASLNKNVLFNNYIIVYDLCALKMAEAPEPYTDNADMDTRFKEKLLNSGLDFKR